MVQAAILILFLTAIVSFILVGTVASYTAYQNIQNVQKDKNELSFVTKQIISNIKYIGNNKTVPLGIDGSDYHQLPDWLMFNKNNAFGIPYMYCPYSLNNTLTANNTVLLNDTTTYDVETINSALTDNNDYVLASDPAPLSNVLALIVSVKEDTTAYTCSDITYTDNKFQLPDPTHGRVVAITNDSILASDLVKVETYNIEQSNDTLEADLTTWGTNQPDRFIVSLKSGDTYDINSDINFHNSEVGKRKEIFINGESDISQSIFTNTGTNSLSFSNVVLTLKNISMTGKYSLDLDNVELYIDNSIIKNINAKNSKITFNDVSIQGINLSSTTPVNLENSELIFKNGSVNNFTMRPSNKNLITALNSEIKADNSTINFSTRGSIDTIELFNTDFGVTSTTLSLSSQTGVPNSFIWLDSSSNLSGYSLNIEQTQSNSAIHTFGKVNLNNSSISMADNSDSGIILNRGAHLEMNSSNIVNSSNNSFEPLYGIKDLGGLFVGGTGNNIYAKTDCLDGDLFEKNESITVVDDTIASVNTDFSINPTSNNDNITFNIRDYFNKFSATCY